MSRLVDRLIEQVRRQTENEEVTATTGIVDEEIIQYINDAQDRLQSVVLAAHNYLFSVEKFIDVVAQQEAYDLPHNIYLENKIRNIEFSRGSTADDYYHLQQLYLKNRDTAIDGFPTGYIIRNQQVLLTPKPQSGGNLRLNYIKRIDRLDKRRGILSTATTSGNTITSLIIDPTGTPPMDRDNLLLEQYMCIADRNGRIKMRNIPFDAIDQTTGTVTVTAGYEFEDGETIEVGDYVVGGQDTTTHSELPRMCERYLIAYASWKMLKRDSSIDYQEQQTELTAMENDITNSMGEINDDITYIPVTKSWFDWED